jgi:putative ABC transport system ATP-binding protein
MNSTSAPLVHLDNIEKSYHTGKVSVRALEEVSLSVHAGEFVTIVGPSGSGKSTLMNILGCLDVPTSGTYRLEGTDVGRLSPRELAKIRNRKIGFVFQNFNLLPYATAYENCEVPLIFAGLRKEERKSRIDRYLGRVGLAARADHRPTELSGGEMQRVAIARALVNGPSLILADEPTGNLDSASGRGIIELFRELNAEGTTVMMITHDEHIAAHSRRLVRIADGKVDGDTT